MGGLGRRNDVVGKEDEELSLRSTPGSSVSSKP